MPQSLSPVQAMVLGVLDRRRARDEADGVAVRALPAEHGPVHAALEELRILGLVDATAGVRPARDPGDGPRRLYRITRMGRAALMQAKLDVTRCPPAERATDLYSGAPGASFGGVL